MPSPDDPAREHLVRCWQIASVARPPGLTVAEWTDALLRDPVDDIIADHASLCPSTLPPPWDTPPPEVAALARRYLLSVAQQWLQTELDLFCADVHRPPAEIHAWFDKQLARFGRYVPLRWISYESRFIVLPRS